jgi:murein DD-endopeptidase MepM/ murein hydrolase activator NlpD
MTWQTGCWISFAALAVLAIADWASAQSAARSPASAATSQPAGPKWTVVPATGAPWQEDLAPQHRTLDLNIGELQEVVLPDGYKAAVKLLSVETVSDDLRQAVRQTRVKLLVNGQEATISSAMYNLPQAAGGAAVDCPIVAELKANGRGNPWALEKAARIRIWPAGAAWIDPNTFVYPVRQRWFAGPTQMANEPTYVDGVEQPLAKKIYYHYGLDFGGAERLIAVVSATDGLVVSAGMAAIDKYPDMPVKPRYDTVNILDRRGWFHRYSHLISIDPGLKAGQTVKMGAKIGVLGKEGDSGGWSHLHYQIDSRQASGKWGTEEAYAFVWQAYMAENKPKIVAVARPHVLASAGGTVELDGGKSWSASGKIDKYEWTFTDGATAAGAKASHKYDKPGQYCETLKITDAAGNVGYDFAIVQVADKDKPKELPPGIHLACSPTTGVRPGAEVTFKVRSFGTTAGGEQIDFGDGTPPAKAKSDGAVDEMAKDGYAIFAHAFAKGGPYVVTARRTNERGQEGVTRVLVVVEKE